MISTLEQFLFVVFTLSIINHASAKCTHISNDDMIEYNCEGGTVVDLLSVPDNTEKIRITRMSIPRLTANVFSRFGPNLWVLSCSHCDIEYIDDDAFRTLENLQQLSLDDNKLRMVRANWFRGLEYLTYLDLNHNEIEEIESGVFENTPHLVDLRVSGNRLQCLNVEEMKKLKQLKRIFITENPDFKCPNAITQYSERQGITVEKDPFWNDIQRDMIKVSSYDNSNHRSTTTETPEPIYRERLRLQHYETSSHFPDTTTPRLYYTRPVVYPPVTETWTTTTTESDMINFHTSYFNNRRPDDRSDESILYNKSEEKEDEDEENSDEDFRKWGMEHNSQKAPPSMPVEIIHPAVPDDFFQGPYYAPKVTNPQVIDNYRQPSEVTADPDWEDWMTDRINQSSGAFSIYGSSSMLTFINVNIVMTGLWLVIGVLYM